MARLQNEAEVADAHDVEEFGSVTLHSLRRDTKEPAGGPSHNTGHAPRYATVTTQTPGAMISRCYVQSPLVLQG